MLTACISTQEMPVVTNVVRIDTKAKGLLFTGQTVPQTMRAAATATISRGYTHFKFADAELRQGSVVAGVVGQSNTNYSGTYNGTYNQGLSSGSLDGSASTIHSASVVRAPTAAAAATVIMYRATDPESKDAFDAEQVLKQYSQ